MNILSSKISRSFGLVMVILAFLVVLGSPKVTAPQPTESRQLSQEKIEPPPPPPPQLPFGGRQLIPNF
ncbi:MAG: hypothetical protein AAB459_02605, partial [Patescibacteria group bacterium]